MSNQTHKILVFMSDNRLLNNNKETSVYSSLVASINKTYCDKYNYDFIYYVPYYRNQNDNNVNMCIDPNSENLRHASWAKLLSALESMKKSYDYVLYIDSDCCFSNMDISIESIIENYKNNDIIFYSNNPWHPSLPCGGFFICKNNIDTQNFIRYWFNYKNPTHTSNEWKLVKKKAQKETSYDWNIGKHWEQDTLFVIYVLEYLKFDDYKPSIESKLIFEKISIGLINEKWFEESPNQFLRHVCSTNSNTDRTKYFKSKVDLLENMINKSYQNIINDINVIKFDIVNYDNLIMTFDTRKDMLLFYSKQLTKPVIAEIGIFKGDFLKFLYENCNASKINAIDLFQGTTPSGNEDGNFLTYYDMNKSYNELKEKYKDTIVTLHKSDSSTFLNTLNDNYYDIIYIDGDHSYNGVKKDLIASYNKIKNNGYIMGHDYEMNMKKANHHYEFGTKQAVDEFCVNYNQKILAKAYDGCVSFCIKINK